MDEQLSFDMPMVLTCKCCGQEVEGAKILVDHDESLIYNASHTAYLTRQEFKVVKLLIDRSPNMITKESLYDLAFVDDRGEGPSMKIVDVIICKIRKKIEPVDLIIETVWGKGYKLIDGTGKDPKAIKEAAMRTRDRSAFHRWTPEFEKHLVELMSRKMNVTTCATIMRLPYSTVERNFNRLRETHFAKINQQ
jgi:DNA-binding winged helix-turn-helix (wHTH) protein